MSYMRFGPLVYLAFTVVWCGSVYYDVQYQPRLGHDWYIYKLVMLTNIDFILITVYSLLALAGSLGCGKAQKAADYCHYTSVVPVALTTCLLFWGLYAADPQLVMPDWVAALIPQWLNQVTHTLPVVYTVVDSWLTRRQAPSVRQQAVMSALLVAVYFAVIFAVRHVDGYWLYPILELLTPQLWLAAFAGAVVGYFALVRFAVTLNGLLWRNTGGGKRQKKRV